MPVRETLGLSKDSFVRALPFLGADDAPPSPPEDVPPPPPSPGYYFRWSFKGLPPWYNSDDSYNSVATPHWFNSWSVGDAFMLAALIDGYYISGGWDGSGGLPATPGIPGSGSSVGSGVAGFYTGTGSTNHYIPEQVNGPYFYTPGTELHLISWGIDVGSDKIYSNPFKVKMAIYDVTNTILLHDFGEMEVDTHAYLNGIVSGFYIYPFAEGDVAASDGYVLLP